MVDGWVARLVGGWVRGQVGGWVGARASKKVNKSVVQCSQEGRGGSKSCVLSSLRNNNTLFYCVFGPSKSQKCCTVFTSNPSL